MNIQQWRNIIVRAVEDPSSGLLDSLAQHVAECEEAKTILRHKGYGITGQSVLVTVRLVPQAVGRR